MANYIADPNDSTKMIPAQKQSQNASGIATFATDALAQVSNPTAGTMTFSQESDKIFIYNGTSWVKTSALS
tara:strand:- start:416 stop:628 length:213 start_codon:yes stop_codon:yes gene_type:complete